MFVLHVIYIVYIFLFESMMNFGMQSDKLLLGLTINFYFSTSNLEKVWAFIGGYTDGPPYGGGPMTWEFIYVVGFLLYV